MLYAVYSIFPAPFHYEFLDVVTPCSVQRIVLPLSLRDWICMGVIEVLSYRDIFPRGFPAAVTMAYIASDRCDCSERLQELPLYYFREKNPPRVDDTGTTPRDEGIPIPSYHCKTRTVESKE